MKCPNCGHELEAGSGFCENCGMITSLENEDAAVSSNGNNDSFREVYSGTPDNADPVKDDESLSQNGENPEKAADEGSARELEADDTEQIVPVVEYHEQNEERGDERSAAKSETSDFEEEDEYIEDEEVEKE